jgi:hypothetical protein
MHWSSKGYVRLGTGSFKCGLFALIVASILSGCVTQRRCAEKFPAQPADTVIKEIVTYRDTTVYIALPADTITDSIFIAQPCPGFDDYSSDTVRVDKKLASASAWITHRKLKIELAMKEAILEFTIDSIASTRTQTITITETEYVKQRYVPPIYIASLFVNIVLILLFILGIFLSLRG